MSKEYAVKDNEDKLPWSVLTVDLAYELWQVAMVLWHGMKSRGRKNWQKGKPNPNWWTDAIDRHQHEINMGNLIDEDSGQPHRAHIIANHLFDLWYENKERKDNRWL